MRMHLYPVPFCRFIKVFPLVFSSILMTACSGEPVTSVEKGVLTQSIEASGELVSADTVSMMPPSIRRVWQYQVKMLAPEGSKVKQGDLVAQLDTSELTQRLSVKAAKLDATLQDIATSKLRNAKRLEVLRLELAEAQMNVEKAERKFNLSDETVAKIDKIKYEKDAVIARDKLVLTEKKLDLENQSAKQREAMLEGDKQKFASEVAALKRGIDSLTLIAPREGMVVYGNDSQGNKIKEGQSVFMGDAVLSIPDLNHMQVNMTIPEVEASRVKLGQKLKIRLDANPDKVFHGEIIELGAVFRHKNQEIPLVIFDAVASIFEADTELMRPGMTAKISIDIANETEELLLSLDAVHYEAGQAYVLLPSLFGETKQNVRIATIGKEQVSIRSGLEVGQEVLLP